ncbi:cobalt ABC transporter, inner membrane subunit CbiQ [[Leptolyngbya] sp. PCC 7376]|uniref:cobalt ECF transporter T component CbiQ n=1 Tax=[Leptolyngbya] sp. PCC 7376 TaxID=111781 RepID=UPI00029F28B2|nr:cobalt ECF transporter T component CbiQ [[Leptolyngbya] sp. PCC 7376]AFY36980.1 cobalt ABC transporter, inner membrane subunit CbiQ [[Leptolyngbya] sp. PCC 7376]
MAIATHADIFIPGKSAIHRWAVRPKLLSLLTLMFAIALVRHLALIPAVLVIVALLFLYSGLSWRYLSQRLSYPGIFIVAMVGLLPWVAGETILWQWMIFTLRLEGLQTAILIMGRFFAILTTSFILLGTTPFLDMLKALRSLGLPPLLMDMALLTYRYLFDIANQLATMRQAMQLRGYGLLNQTLQRRWGWLVALFGSLLLRSYERSQRVYKAMRLRGDGHGGNLSYTTASRHIGSRSVLPTVLTLLAALSLVIGESILTFL